jgi:hypothetical protein
VTIRGGRVNDVGGGIRSAGPLTISNSTVKGNHGHAGGGIHSAVSLTLLRSTISGNQTLSDGGGLRAVGTATITNTTISGNSITGANNGSGIALGNSTTLTATNVAIANNSSAQNVRGALTGPAGSATLKNTVLSNAPTANCFNRVEKSAGHNLSSGASCNFDQSSDKTNTNPTLGPLQNNGGQTNTHALKKGSPALNTIPEGTNGCGTEIKEDQRGVERPQGSGCDIGAFEKKKRR